MTRITDAELETIQVELSNHLCQDRVEPVAAADFATRALARLLGECKNLRRENAALRQSRSPSKSLHFA